MTEDRTTHELDAPPWLRVDTTLMTTARMMREAYDARLAAVGLNLTQASLIAYLNDFGPITQTKCADHLRLGRAVIGVTIDRLQERQLVARLPDAVDRRVWRIALTERGVATAVQIASIDEVLRREMRSGITRAERQALASLMTRLQENLLQAIDTTRMAEPTATHSTITTISSENTQMETP